MKSSLINDITDRNICLSDLLVLNRKLTISQATVVYSVYSLMGGLNNYLVSIFNKKI